LSIIGNPHNVGEDALMIFVSFFIILFQLSYLPDVAVKNLIKFINVLFKLAAEKNGDDALLEFGTIDRIKRKIGFNAACDGIVEYAQCVKCYSVYRLHYPSSPPPSKCIFPDVDSISLLCDEPLFANTTTKNPIRLLVYHSLKYHIKRLATRRGFEDVINHHKYRQTPPDELNDVYDGYIWKNLKLKDNTTPFFSIDPADDNQEIRLGIAINLDWTSVHSNVSSGALYVSILNLPRPERNKPCNVLLSFLFNGAEAPTSKINQAIQPLIEELQDLYVNGFLITTFNSKKAPRRVRVALINTSSDNPAARKLNCFTGCSSHRSCWYCTLYFPSLPGNCRKRDFSNFPTNISLWHNLDMTKTNREARIWKSIRDKSKRDNYAKKTGLRWSEFRSLPYYNVNRCTTTDGMHCLFLSQVPLLMSLYEEFGLIKKSDYEV